MPGTSHPIEAVIIDGIDVQKAAFRSYVRERTALLLADAAELNATDLEGQLLVQLKSTGRTYAIDTSDTTTVDDGVECIRDANAVAYKKQAVTGVDGVDGADGTDPGVLLTWDVANDDSNPASGGIKASNDDLSLAAFLYVSKTNRGGDSIASYLSSIGDSTNTAYKGHVILTRPGGNSQALFKATSLTDATGYVKIGVTFVGGTTGFLAGNVSLQFLRAGDKGATGAAGSSAGAGLYQTRAALAADTVDSALDIIQVFRYSTATKAAPVFAERLASTPAPVEDWHMPDLSGVYFFMRTRRVQPDMFGAIGDNATDDSTAIQAAVNYALAQNAWVELPRKYASSTFITKPDGTDPGALIIEGCGFDTTGLTFTGGTQGIYCPATGSHRNVGLRFSNFKIDGSNTGDCGIYVTNALDCVIDMLHIVRFCSHSIFMGKTTGYGHLRVTIRDCKTSPSNVNGNIVSGATAVKLDAGNYCTLQNNYFSGFIDASHRLSILVDTSGDSTLMSGNILETTLHGVEISGGAFGSYSDKPIASTITGRHFIVNGNLNATIITPRDTTVGDIDVTGANTALLNVILEGAGKVYP